ncbi:MAG: hypothetical protein LBU40_00250 [Methanobrevibacter sp.]|jgi:hypothetical protein|nr:hypothetical protein [Methanobrevibacter sp.]
MVKYVLYNGYKVYPGVKWTVDKKSITITCHPKRTDKGKFPYRPNSPYTRTWKNYCPKCGKSGRCTGIGQGKGEFGPEGGVRCNACDADYCGVSGLDTKNSKTRVRLTKGSSSSSSSSTQKLSDLTAKKKKAKQELESEYNQSKHPKKNMILKIPPIDKIIDGYCHQLSPPLVKKDLIVYVESVELSDTENVMTVNDKLEAPGEEYKPPSNASSAKNYIGNSEIEKKIMVIGDSLKKSTGLNTVKSIYNYMKSRGTGGFRYSYYYNWPGGSINKLNESVLAKRWKMKSGNCVFFAWAFYVMCKGAGIKGVKIIHNSAGHLYNTYKGKKFDCSNASSRWFRGSNRTITTS